MKITKHAKDRWKQRVGEDEQEISKKFNKATYVWTAEDESEFYLYDNIMFVAKNDHIVTVLIVDYGFGKEINDSITKSLLAEIDRLQVEIEEMENSPELARLDQEMDDIDAQIKALANEVDRLQKVRNKVFNEKEAILKEKDNKVYDCESACKKLCYSLSWRIENLGKKVG